ncbi:filamentous hemagglutinin N-terminal domain-containing protein [Niveispirillum sp. SYP-B3756]|uniref:two-partner secretion domain-containing protein n=1 Tax=Niveispirillum sp. SYP-B3756 TaxID=2662178 RepID=UPI0012926526|nr:filamentous hemagglutinin N-terminal domain-containing protein [Niveispirillum sp. SYP-B3756]MQP68108.1 filamentous hemagglutinin N-terminal domain-containing protein [Niveispirillum sp. SYP-B3756]
MVRDMLSSRRHLLAGSALTGVLALAMPAGANPSDPTIVHGTVGFAGSGPVLEVTQGSDKAIIDWRSFAIANGEVTRFIQPGSGAIALNRVTGDQASVLNGQLTANGQIFLINPNGILFGAGAQVDVAGLVATTANIDNQKFLSGDYRFDIASPLAGAAVVNEGRINAGMAALVAPHVRNSGTITAELGTVSLGAAQRFTLDLAGDGLISFDAGSAVDGAKLEQAGRVSGATVLLSAATAARVVDNVIDMTGVVEARGAYRDGGDIVLDGGAGAIAVSGTLDASGPVGGGNIQVGSAQTSRLDVTATAAMRADATENGSGGHVTLMSAEQTRFAGSISAKGAGAGQGGNAEVSSAGRLSYQGRTDLTAESGVKGTLLLDPKNIIVAATGSSDVAGNDGFGENAGSDATLSAAAVVAALNGANLVLQANNDISVNAAVNASANAGAGDLTLRAGRSVALNADVTLKGGLSVLANDPAALAAQRDPGTGSISVASGVTVTTSGAQSYQGDLSLAGNLVGSGSGAIGITGALSVGGLAGIVTAGGAADNVTVSNGTNGPGFLLVDAGAGSVSLGTVGAAQALSGLSLKGGSVIVGDVTTTGRQDYAGAVRLAGNLVSTTGGTIRLGGPVTLTGDSAIVSAGAAGDDIRFTSTVNGPYALVTDAGKGAVSFGGAVGNMAALKFLSAGGATVTVADVTTTGQQDYAGAMRLAGNLVSTTGGSIRLGGSLILTGDSAIVSAGAAGDDIRFTSTVNGGYALVTDAGKGAVSFGGAVGGATALKFLSAGGATVTVADVTTTGQQDYAGAMRLAGNLVSTKGGTIRLGGPVTLTGDSAVVSAGAAGDDIRFTGTVNGGYALVTDAGKGAVSFGGAVGNMAALKFLSAGGDTVTVADVTTSGQQDYAGAMRLAGNLVSTKGGTIRLGGPVTLTGDSAIVSAGAAGDDIRFTSTVNGAYALVTDAGKGAVSFGGAVGNMAALKFLSAGGSTVTVADVTTTGQQDYAGAVRLAGNLVSTMGGPIRLGGPVTLTGDSAIVSAGAAGDDIRFTSTVNGAYALVTDAGKGAVSFGGAVGNMAALKFLSAGGDTVTVADVTTSGQQDYAGAVRLAGNLVSTKGGTIRLGGPVTLTGDSAVVSAGAAGDDIRFTSTVNGAYALVTDAGKGAVSFGGAVGNMAALKFLSAGGDTVTVADVTTSGQQDYAGAVRLAGNLVSTKGGTIRLGGSLILTGDSAIVSAGAAGDDIRFTGTVNGGYALVTDAGKGAVSFGGAVGNMAALKFLSAGGDTVTVADVTTSGQQDYAGAVRLAGNLVSTKGGTIRLGGPVTLTGDSAVVSAGAAGDDIRFTGTVNGAYALVTDAGKGAVSFGGAVGNMAALKFLSAGGDTVTVADVTTSGQQDYAGAVRLAGNLVSTKGGTIRLGGPVTLTGDSAVVSAGAAGDDIRFTGTVNGAYALVTDAGKGAVSFGGAVGNMAALKFLSAGGATVTVADVTTTGQQDYAGAMRLAGNLVSTKGGTIRLGGPVTLTGDSAVVSAGAAGDDIRFTGTVNGAYALVTDAGKGAVSFGGAVGNMAALKFLSAGGSTVTVADVTTTGQQDYAGAVRLAGNLVSMTGGTIRLGGPVTLTGDSAVVSAGAAGDDIRFTGTVDGGYALVTDAGKGAVSFGGAVGGATALKLLSAGGTTVTVGNVTTTGQQDYAGTMRLGGNLVSTTGGSVGLSGLLTLTADSRISSAGAASDNIRLAGGITGPYQLTLRSGKGDTIVGRSVLGLSGLDVAGAMVSLGGPVEVTGALVANAARLSTLTLSANTITLTGTEALSALLMGASQDISINAGKGATLSDITGRNVTLTAGDSLTAGAVTAVQDVTVTGTSNITLGTVTGSNLALSAGRSLALAGINAQNATLTAGTDFTAFGPLRLSRTLELVTNGRANAGTVEVGALTYRGSGLFSANGSIAGISGPDAADLVQVAGSRTGTYLFAGRPVYGLGALVERQRLDVLVVDTGLETGRDDGRQHPLRLDPAAAAAADPLITFKD